MVITQDVVDAAIASSSEPKMIDPAHAWHLMRCAETYVLQEAAKKCDDLEVFFREDNRPGHTLSAGRCAKAIREM